MGRKLIDLTGRTFERITVISLAEIRKVGAAWNCRCSCGNEKIIYGHLLRRGQVKSCGCQRSEAGSRAIRAFMASGRPHPQLKHGDTKNGRGTSEWTTWHAMRQRCSNPKCAQYRHYGGRGIRVSAEWVLSYETFLRDVGRRPTPEHSLDRIDVDGHYEKGNVRWATRKEQARNKRNSLLITALGKSLTLAEWSEITGIQNTTIRNRLLAGWPADRAVSTEVAKCLPAE